MSVTVTASVPALMAPPVTSRLETLPAKAGGNGGSKKVGQHTGDRNGVRRISFNLLHDIRCDHIDLTLITRFRNHSEGSRRVADRCWR